MTKEIERERKKFQIKVGRFARESIEELSTKGYSKEEIFKITSLPQKVIENCYKEKTDEN